MNVDMMFSLSILRSCCCSKQPTGLTLWPQSPIFSVSEWLWNFLLIWTWNLSPFSVRSPLKKRIKICVVIQNYFHYCFQNTATSPFSILSIPLPLPSVRHQARFLCWESPRSAAARGRSPTSPLHLCNEKQVGVDSSRPSRPWSTQKHGDENMNYYFSS